MPGYVDWQRVQTRVLPPLNEGQTSLQPSTGPSIGPYFVGNLERVFISLQLNGTGTYNISFVWCLNADGTGYVNEFDGGINGNSDIWTQSLPVQAPYLQMIITPVSGVTSDTLTAYLLPNSNAVPMSESRSPILVIADQAAIGANTFKEFNSQYIAPGPARVHFYSSVATWFAEVKMISSTGVSTTIAHWSVTAANTTISETVVLPAFPCLLHVNNSTASSGNFDASLASMTY